MPWYSALALYLLFWVFTFFLILPIGVRTAEEEGAEPVPGQAPSAPQQPMLWKKVGWTTAVSAVVTTLFVANWQAEWLTRAEFLAMFPPW
jgi:predicted secreted protein